MPIESGKPAKHLILCCPLLLLPSVFPRIRVFSNESARRIRWPKYWSFSISISPSNEYSELISFRTDWFDLLAVQGTLKSLPKHYNLKASIQWCHPAISSSVVPFFSCPQSLPASESFPMSQLFAWGGQSTGVSASASFLPKKSQGWSPLEWAGWISLQSKGLSRIFSNTTVQKHQFFGAQPSSQSNTH